MELTQQFPLEIAVVIVAVVLVVICCYCYKNLSKGPTTSKTAYDWNDVRPFNESATILDLHGCSKQQALEEVRKFINKQEQMCRNYGSPRTVKIITGKGLHSRGGVPVLRDAVIEYLYAEGYRYEITDDGGAVKVYMKW